MPEAAIVELGPETLEALHQMLVLMSAPAWAIVGSLLISIVTEKL